jgi:hypothetical protein
MLVFVCAVAQAATGRTKVQHVSAAAAGKDLRVEITLSNPVNPSSETVSSPSRIVLDFPDTICGKHSRNIPVHANGVRRVRVRQHSVKPYVTRIVVDLDEMHRYEVARSGNRVIVVVKPNEKRSAASYGAPAAALSCGLACNLRSIFGRRKATNTSSADARPDGMEEYQPLEQPAPNAPASAKENNGSASDSAIADEAARKPRNRSAASVSESSNLPSFDRNQPSVATNEDAVQASANTTTAAAPSTLIARSDNPSLHTVFKVKYVAEGVAYLEGGRAQGLAEGMKLVVLDSGLPATQGMSVHTDDPKVVAELVVSGLAEVSAVTDIHDAKRPVKVGDLAYLSNGDAEALVQQRALSKTRRYPVVISFTESDTLDDEAREAVPRPPLPSVNRARGRIGFDTIQTFTHGTSSVASSDVGVVFRGDITRIAGTHWNLSGYWRGRLTKQSAASQKTLQNLINRTYHLTLTYDNPNSTLVAGFGRLYLPWAPSLDTIDGGYVGKRFSRKSVVGVFGGSTPDPSSWDYSPNRVIGGAFVNFEDGGYDGFHITSTSGAAVSMVDWIIDRPFLFFENSLSYKRVIGIYESAQFDSPRGNSVTPAPGPGLGRNFFTFRVRPHPRAELNVNYTYFRQIPTFDTALIGTSLLDKYLFQGFSAGGRVEVWKRVWVSTNLGRSSGSGDGKTSLNQLYGITFGRLPFLRLRAGAHYARFNSAFGEGSYESFSLSRRMSERLRLELLAGRQDFTATMTTNTRGRFVTGTVETTLGPRYYLRGSFTTNRGDSSYDQFMVSMGYRFDNRGRRQ